MEAQLGLSQYLKVLRLNRLKVYYQPNPAGVSSGSKVTWTNNDIAPHTSGVSSTSTNSGKIFDTGLISPGSTGSALVTGNGKIPYHCTFHPWMTGTIQITGSNQALKGTSPSQNKTFTVTSQRQTTSTVTVPVVNDSSLKVVPVVSNLSMPTTMAFVGLDDFLLLQKGGTVIRVTNGTISTNPLLNVSVQQ